MTQFTDKSKSGQEQYCEMQSLSELIYRRFNKEVYIEIKRVQFWGYELIKRGLDFYFEGRKNKEKFVIRKSSLFMFKQGSIK